MIPQRPSERWLTAMPSIRRPSSSTEIRAKLFKAPRTQGAHLSRRMVKRRSVAAEDLALSAGVAWLGFGLTWGALFGGVVEGDAGGRFRLKVGR